MLGRMDFQHPVQAVIPGAQGRILSVLLETPAELSLRTIARLASVSSSQASRVLPRMVSLGLVERRDVPPSTLYQLVRDHVAARPLQCLARGRDRVLDQLRQWAASLTPAPVSMVVFGSFARGEAGADSDVDVVVIRPHRVSDDDDSWAAALEQWQRRVERLTGNPVNIVEIGQSEVGALLRSGRPLWAEVLRDGLVLTGRPLDDLDGDDHV